MGFFFGMRHITHARAHSSVPTTFFALPKADYNQLVKLYPDQVQHYQQHAPVHAILLLSLSTVLTMTALSSDAYQLLLTAN